MFVKERNTIPLPSSNITTRIALIYPNVYEMGMSSYTIHLLFSLFNSYKGISCERFFLPKQKESHASLKSIDTGRKLENFDILAFSIHYELDYVNLLWILEKTGIPLLAHDRITINNPLIIAGGSAVKSNPLILLPFLDALVFGDIEPIFRDFCKILTQNNEKSDILAMLCALPNILVSRYAIDYLYEANSNKCEFPTQRKYLENLDESINPTRQILPQFRNPEASLVFGETFLLEINRGCPDGCRFCLTGYVNRPFRNRSFTQIQHIIDDSITDTAAKKITLIGSAIGNHPNFEEICQYIVDKGLQLMIPSIRVDCLTPNILNILRQGSLKSLTIAPETGTDILRRKLNKGIRNSDIVQKCEEIFAHGFQSIKMYFLVGLPFENPEDIQGIIELVQEIREKVGDFLPKKGLRLSINPFIPKFFTPYGQYVYHFLTRKMEYFRDVEKTIRTALGKNPHIDLEFLNWKEARIQAVLSQLDDNFSQFLIEFYKKGAHPVTLYHYDQEHEFVLSRYLQNTYEFFTKSLIDTHPSKEQQPVQWAKLQKLINIGFHDDYLYRELHFAKKELITGCDEDCHRCGIC